MRPGFAWTNTKRESGLAQSVRDALLDALPELIEESDRK